MSPTDKPAPPTSANRPLPPPAAAPQDSRQRLGSLGEQLAVAHFRALGFDVLDRNRRTSQGEIDLVVFDGRTLVFAEVKTRRVRARRDESVGPGPAPMSPLEGLRTSQRLRLRRAAAAWLQETRSRPGALELRFDAVGVVLDNDGRPVRLDHVEGAL